MRYGDGGDGGGDDDAPSAFRTLWLPPVWTCAGGNSSRTQADGMHSKRQHYLLEA